MTETASSLASGKDHKGENFPVASFLIAPRYRPTILAFYRFARTADDVADHATASPAEKLRLLDGMQQSLLGNATSSREAVALRHALGARGLSHQHALDLLEAFRRDVTKLRYADWNELMDYCRYSAMPVGRFVLDVHGEDRALWPHSDALCAALQVINHLQDCGKDYRTLDRVYLPLNILARTGARPEELATSPASPALRNALVELSKRTDMLLAQAKPFAEAIADFRLGLEVTVIQKLAESLNRGLKTKDPLSQRVHHRKSEMAGLALTSGARYSFLRARHPRIAHKPALEP